MSLVTTKCPAGQLRSASKSKKPPVAATSNADKTPRTRRTTLYMLRYNHSPNSAPSFDQLSLAPLSGGLRGLNRKRSHRGHPVFGAHHDPHIFTGPLSLRKQLKHFGKCPTLTGACHDPDDVAALPLLGG